METVVAQKTSHHDNFVGSNIDQPTLREHVHAAVRNYFANLEGEMPSNLYDLVLAEVEAPLLEVVMDKVRDNQTRAAQVLGLNRGTLRKKLKQYDLCK